MNYHFTIKIQKNNEEEKPIKGRKELCDYIKNS